MAGIVVFNNNKKRSRGVEVLLLDSSRISTVQIPQVPVLFFQSDRLFYLKPVSLYRECDKEKRNQ